MSKQRDKFTAARVAMITRYVFFGCIAMQLELVEDSSLSHAAATDGKRLIFNPELTEPWTFGETLGVVCHEVLHVVFMHHLRRKGRKPGKWNIACDHAVNLELKKQFGKAAKPTDPSLPGGALCDDKYLGMSAEQIYDLLPDQPEDEEGGQGQGQGFDVVMDGASGMSESEVAAMEASVKGMIQNAAAMARKAGQMSGKLAKMVEAISEPKANWRAIIQDYLTQKAEIDYSWAKPNQRMLHQYSVIYPTLDGEKIGNIGVILDTSGSCYRDQEQFCAEVSDILSEYEVELTVFYVDTEIKGIDTYSQSDLPIVLRTRGYGGTCVASAYATILNDYNFVLLLHCTDGEIFDWGKVEEPNCPVLIALTNKRAKKDCPAWATVISID